MRRSVSLTALVCFAAVGCSSDEFTASPTGGTGGDAGGAAGAGGTTSGTGGTGAGGATGGSAGAGGLPTSCTKDADCDDGLACNGKETCGSTGCVAGTPMDCQNPDAAHCESACKESAGTGTCVVVGKDADGDQHLDAACTADTTADDCDDANKAVFPGASEVCDGIDNDCNGKDEFEEGTSSPTGSSKQLADAAYFPDVAWSPTDKHYGVVWRDAFGGGIQYARVTPAGDMVGSKVQVSADDAAPRVAWSGSHFAVAWSSGGRVKLRRVSPNATFPEAAKPISDGASKAGDPDVAATATGWTVIWSDARTNTLGTLYAHAVDAAGTPTAGGDKQVGDTGGANKAPAIASGSGGLFVAEERGSTAVVNAIKVFGLSASFAVSGAKDLPTGASPKRPAVAATDDGWSGGWSEPTALRYYEQHGTTACSPISVSASAPLLGSVAARGSARLAVFGEGSSVTAKVQLVRFKAGCVSTAQLKLADVDIPDWTGFGPPVAAWSDQSVLVLWSDESTGTAVLHRWASGPNLCDAVQ
ncbi:MAG: putative metal-binding motif-containing protein [Myxococcales bacterium]|nr:putative metal-binding motif-containing protein [Myxococcales bacterium]MCB9579106.1 putative metal-binding motif-containing protein [Polyangiaceae bacterium]